VRKAVQAEIERIPGEKPRREQFAALRRAHPLPPPTGKQADKAFFDDLSSDP
jgi:hypothetical protein